jgi:hypothetical protein
MLKPAIEEVGGQWRCHLSYGWLAGGSRRGGAVEAIKGSEEKDETEANAQRKKKSDGIMRYPIVQ